MKKSWYLLLIVVITFGCQVTILGNTLDSNYNVCVNEDYHSSIQWFLEMNLDFKKTIEYYQSDLPYIDDLSYVEFRKIIAYYQINLNFDEYIEYYQSDLDSEYYQIDLDSEYIDDFSYIDF